MIEEKIRQLSPERQREVEDFIDFLLKKDSIPARDDTQPVRSADRTPPERPILTAGEKYTPGESPGNTGKQEDSGLQVNLSDLAYQKRPRPDPEHLLEWID